MTALGGGGPTADVGGRGGGCSVFVLDNSMDGSDDLFDPLVAGETNPILLPYQTHNKPIFTIYLLQYL